MRRAQNRNEKGDILTYKQTAERCNLGLSKVIEIARESGALIKIGRAARVDYDTFYNYIIDKYRITE